MAGIDTAAGSTMDYTFSVGLQGYRALGVIGTAIHAGGPTSLVHAYMTYPGGNYTVVVRTRNNGTVTGAPQFVDIWVLYVKIR